MTDPDVLELIRQMRSAVPDATRTRPLPRPMTIGPAPSEASRSRVPARRPGVVGAVMQSAQQSADTPLGWANEMFNPIRAGAQARELVGDAARQVGRGNVGRALASGAMAAMAVPGVPGPDDAARGARKLLNLSEDGLFRDVRIGDTAISYKMEGGEMHIVSVRTPAAKRNQGSARAAMQSVLREADEAGVPLRLESSPLDKRTNDRRLQSFYASLGFTPTGRKINAVGDPEMVRTPMQGHKE